MVVKDSYIVPKIRLRDSFFPELSFIITREETPIVVCFSLKAIAF